MTDADLDPSDAPEAAPPVVAVVVTADPGDWLEESLAALGRSDYPNLSVLVVDAASAVDPTPRIASVLPSAYVRRLDGNPGFGAAANDVLTVVEGASHFVFLHDDVAPDPDAIRLLVEEAYRSNAGVVAPKIADWNDPVRLLNVGAAASRTGAVTPYGRGDLDQEQHDAVRDVFVAPGGCQLVRADLFETLGGFDPAITSFGEDLDLSWRAQIAGARVVVAPGARVRHREAMATGDRAGAGVGASDASDDLRALTLRHRIRTVLKAYSRLHLVLIVPQLVLVLLIEAALSGRRGWRSLFAALRWNLSSMSELRAARRDAQQHRLVRDAEVRRLQSRGTTRVSAVVRGGVAAEERTLGVGEASRQFAGAITRGGIQLTIGVWLSLAAVLLVGSRHLIGGPLPAVGQFVPLPDNPVDALRLFGSGWRTSGLGSESPAPFAFALFGMGGVLLVGAMGLLQKLLVIGMLPIGIIGAHRMTLPIGSWRSRLVAAVLYAAVPLPYDAIARGRWSVLVAYAAMPWILLRLLRASGLPPFGAPAPREEHATGAGRRRARRRAERGGPRTPVDAVEALLGAEAGTLDAIDAEELRLAAVAVAGRPHDERPAEDDADDVPRPFRPLGTFGEQAAAAAIVVALASALAPSFAIVVLVTGVGLLAGGVVAGDVRPLARSAALAFASVGGAALLLAPWTLELVVPGASFDGILGLGPPASDAAGIGEVLRFSTGSAERTAQPLAWGLLGAAALALTVGRRWRLAWSARLWTAAIVSFGLAFVAGRGWLGIDPPAADVLLAPAAACLVLVGSLGMAAFEVDLPGYRFGWRQLASVAAAAAGLAATIPVLATTLDGRWGLAARDHAAVLSWMPELTTDGDFRIVWVGAPDVVPADPWLLSTGVAYSMSRNGVPAAADLWPASDEGTTGLVADALSVARRGETTRLGGLLGPLGVRFVAVPLEAAATGQDAARRPPPDGLIDALRGQVDLRVIQTDESLVLFENAAWLPIRRAAAGGAPVLDPGSSPLRSSGPVPAGEVVLAEAASPRWRLTVDGASAPRSKALGWANGFAVAADGQGKLGFRTPLFRYGALALELVLWVAALRVVVRGVRRRALERRDDDVAVAA